MKKLISLLGLLSLLHFNGFSQCIPIDCSSSLPPYGGICDEEFLNGVVNQAYSDFESFVLTDACFDAGVFDPANSGTIIQLDNVTNFSFSGLPAGLVATTNQATYTSMSSGPTLGCISLTGTPTEAGVFETSANFTATVDAFIFGACPTGFSVTQSASTNYSLELEIFPDASFFGLNLSYCSIDPDVLLTPNNSGGSFSGPGVFGAMFSPSIAGPGIHTITYTLVQQQGAAIGPSTGIFSITVTVNPAITYYLDADLDGFGDDFNFMTTCNTPPAGYILQSGDCDDVNAAIFPGAAEICNNVDDNCDGLIDEGFDIDNDGFTSCGGDCNDMDAMINPAVMEICNGIDDNCDGIVDEGYDMDMDGFTSCGGDCNDMDAMVNPAVMEICNGIDDNCDGIVDEGFDMDMDGYAPCAGDCDDNDPNINPSMTEICNGIDDDCDGMIDEDVDADLDGFTNCQGDCNDNDPNIYPGATEICNGIDDNCDGNIDDGVTTLSWFIDTDLDGFGDPNDSLVACAQPMGYVLDNNDCDDTNNLINPAITEISNGLDDNCDGIVDEGFDMDMDGYSLFEGDCDDNNADINPGVIELCDNGIDDNCDGIELIGTSMSISATICEGESIEIAGVIFDTADTVIMVDTGTNGCDSTIIIEISMIADNVNFEPISNDIYCIENGIMDLSNLVSPAFGMFDGPGIEGTIFDPEMAGIGTHTIDYTVEYPNGCIFGQSQEVTVDICSNIGELENTKQIKLYPNPCSGVVNLIFNQNKHELLKMSIFDTKGQILSNIYHQVNKGVWTIPIDVSDFIPGLYFLKLENTNGSIVKKIKIID